MEGTYDVAIAGGGAAGAIAAARIAHQHPDLRILVVERDEVLGGRLRTTDLEGKSWGYGLRHITDTLFGMWSQTLREDPEAEDLPTYVTNTEARVGVLSGGKVREIPMREFFSKKGARLIGGLAAGRDWEKVEALVRESSKEEYEDSPLSQVWAGNRKSPAAVVLEHMGRCLGIPDVWSAGVTALGRRAGRLSGTLRAGRWEKALDSMLRSPALAGRVTLQTDCMIVDAKFNNGVWHLDTEKGVVQARYLVVAQSPWEAIMWLPKDQWPTRVLNVALKSKPVSIVVVSDTWAGDMQLPEVIIIPSENVQAVVDNQAHEISFQATIDYELSLQAPDVVKAVKRLHRARRKLIAHYPGMTTKGDRLALVPVGWAQSPCHRDKRYVAKWSASDLKSDALAFCGDAYGSSYDGDENCTKSILTACEAVAEFAGSPAPK